VRDLALQFLNSPVQRLGVERVAKAVNPNLANSILVNFVDASMTFGPMAAFRLLWEKVAAAQGRPLRGRRSGLIVPARPSKPIHRHRVEARHQNELHQRTIERSGVAT
jgi:hypothetical protein